MRRAFLVVLAGLVLAGCGVPIDAEPRVLDIEVDTDIAAPVAAVGDLPVIADIYLVTDGHLVSVGREVADSDPETLLAALLRGPVAAENSLALRSSIPPETAVLAVEVRDGTAQVDLSGAFTLVGGEEEILAVAQIVATLTSLDTIDGVRIAIEGVPRPAPVAEGQLVDRPLVPEDYAELLVR